MPQATSYVNTAAPPLSSNCIRLQVETSDKELLDLKSQLAAIEDMPSFGKNGFKHNLAKRQAEEEDRGEEDEGRGWKNKEKKRKNKKEKKRRKKFDTDLMEEEKERVKEAAAESETKTSDAGAEAPFTSGLQFSAYSPQPTSQPTNQPSNQPTTNRQTSPPTNQPTTTINKQIIKTYSITGKCIQLDRFRYTEKSTQCHIVCFSSILL